MGAIGRKIRTVIVEPVESPVPAPQPTPAEKREKEPVPQGS
jgi:hypothetical protein